MLNQRTAFRFVNLLILLLLCPLRDGGASANPVYPDEESLSNGAQLYDLYCSQCHGSDTSSPYSPLYAPDATHEQAQLAPHKEAATATTKDTDLPMLTKEKAAWPKWAERPDPDAKAPPDPKMETAAELNALIDEAHGIHSGPESDKEPAKPSAEVAANSTAKFEPTPGATNLADPTAYFYGTSEEEMFHSIADGTGTNMTGWSDELGNENAIWDVINYLRSFWGEEWQN